MGEAVHSRQRPLSIWHAHTTNLLYNAFLFRLTAIRSRDSGVFMRISPSPSRYSTVRTHMGAHLCSSPPVHKAKCIAITRSPDSCATAATTTTTTTTALGGSGSTRAHGSGVFPLGRPAADLRLHARTHARKFFPYGAVARSSRRATYLHLSI
ncbi:hypothetical protein BJV74DRAFT_466306 [Russula compacta]|nr:hypothetical protein BJV74DRAFT_466306 [Russula compacta]